MKKKGFTLVEVIISLVLIILIGTITIVSLKKDNTDTTDKSKEELENAIDVTTDKLKSDNLLKQYVTTESDGDSTKIISYFCLTKETLIKEGLITEDNEKLKSIEDGKYIKVSQNSVGTYDFDYDASQEDCSYLESIVTNSEAGYTSEPIDNTKNDDGTFKIDGYYLEHSLFPDSNSNVYNLEIKNFKYNVGMASTKNINTNIYTIFILDGSGSMGSSGYSKVKEATLSLYNNMKNDVSMSSNTKYYSVISFNGNVYRINDATENLSKLTTIFSTTINKNKYFSYSGGGTNFASALETSYNGIKDITADDKTNDTYNRFFIIFLTDGADSSYTSAMNNLKKFLRPQYDTNIEESDYTKYVNDCNKFTQNQLNENNTDIEYGKLITVGYDYSGTSAKQKLKTLSSCGCNSDGNCFYEVDATDITEVYNSFLSIISNTVTYTTYGYIQLSIELGDNFYYDNINNRNIKTEKIELKHGTSIEDQVQSLIENGQFSIKFNSPNVSEANPEGKDYTIIKSINLQFFDKYGNVAGEPVPISVPENKINLATYNVDVIN